MIIPPSFRPSIAGWFDSKIRIWRPTKSDDAIGVEERDYTLSSTVEAVINRSQTSNTIADGGNTEVGTLRWYGLATIDVRPRDVCEIFEGPDAGHTWEVGSFPVRPRNHHTQVDCVEWYGKLPTADSGS